MRNRYIALISVIIFTNLFGAHTITIDKHKSDVTQNCIPLGLVGNFYEYDEKSPWHFGNDIKKGVDIAVHFFADKKRCFKPIIIDINKTIANIPGLIKTYSKKGIVFFIGLGSSSQAQMAIEALKETGGVLISPTSSSDLLIDKGNMGRLILLYPTNSNIANEIANFAKNNHVKSVIIISQKHDSYSQTMANSFKKYFLESGNKIIKEIEIQPHDTDLTKYRKDLLKDNYTHFFLPLYELEVASVISQINALKIKKKFIGTDSWGTWSNVIKTIIDHKHIDAVHPQIYDIKNRSHLNDYFTKAYSKMSSFLPTDLSAFSFEAVVLISKIIDSCKNIRKSSPDECLRKINNFEGVTGNVYYNKNLTFKRQFIITKWK